MSLIDRLFKWGDKRLCVDAVLKAHHKTVAKLDELQQTHTKLAESASKEAQFWQDRLNQHYREADRAGVVAQKFRDLLGEVS